MRYLVTGSAGFIGLHVCSALLSGGNEVVGLDSYTEYYDPVRKRANTASLAAAPGFTEVELDLTVAPLDDLLDGVDAVVHLAGQPGVRLSWADGFATYLDRNVNASQRLLEAARRTRVPRVVRSSQSCRSEEDVCAASAVRMITASSGRPAISNGPCRKAPPTYPSAATLAASLVIRAPVWAVIPPTTPPTIAIVCAAAMASTASSGSGSSSIDWMIAGRPAASVSTGSTGCPVSCRAV